MTSINTGWTLPVSVEKRCQNLAAELRRLTGDVTQLTIPPPPVEDEPSDWYEYERVLREQVCEARTKDTQNQAEGE